VPTIDFNGTTPQVLQFLADEHSKLVKQVSDLEFRANAHRFMFMFVASALSNMDESQYEALMDMTEMARKANINSAEKYANDPTITPDQRSGARRAFEVMAEEMEEFLTSMRKAKGGESIFTVIQGGKTTED
jgi:hypothetical protein